MEAADDHVGTTSGNPHSVSASDVSLGSVTDGADITGSNAPQAHKTSHIDGSDDIQDASNSQKGLATAAHITALEAAGGASIIEIQVFL